MHIVTWSIIGASHIEYCKVFEHATEARLVYEAKKQEANLTMVRLYINAHLCD